MLNLDTLHNRLIVSCQATPDSPLRKTTHMLAMARAALMGNAAGLRAEGIEDVRALSGLGHPLIGLVKREEYRQPRLHHPERGGCSGPVRGRGQHRCRRCYRQAAP